MALSFSMALFGLFVVVAAAAGTDGDQTSLIQIASGAKFGAGEGILSNQVLSQLSSGTGQGAGRSAMLQYGEDVVNLITKKYGAVPEAITDTDKQLLKDIIGIISTTMYGSMRTDHDSDESAITNALKHVEDCNTAKDTEVAGIVTTRRTETQTDRVAHIACRNGASSGAASQTVACLDAFNKNATLYVTLAEITPAPTAPGLPDKDADNAVELFTVFFTTNNTYVDWFNLWSNRFLTEKNAADAAAQACGEHTTQCDGLQHAFEDKYDLYKSAYETTCTTLGTCWTAADGEYTTLQGTLASNVDNRVEAYKAGETIIHKIGCLLGEGGCTDQDIDISEWTLAFPSRDDKDSCDSDSGPARFVEVADGHCSDDFRNREYVALVGHAAAAAGVGC